ncbi:MAG: methyltransferase domain-containing protein [Candidatus Deferrimicrobiaceae bacterium]
MSATAKPRLLLLCDRRGWAFDTTARSLASCLAAEFSIDIRYVAEEPVLDLEAFDLVYIFFWGERYHRKFLSDPDRIVKVVSSHRWEAEERFGRHAPEEAVERYMHDAGTLVTTSLRLYRSFQRCHPRVFHCPNGVDSALFRMERDRSGSMRVGWAGNIEDRQKGVEEILLPACDGRFDLSLARGDIPVERMGEFYNSLDVFCVASVAEGEPLTLLEAMACGCFPVCTDVGVVPELVESGKNGLIVERTPEAFREALAWCREHLGQVREAGRRNAALLRERRSWEAVSGRFADATRSVLRDRENRSRDPKTGREGRIGDYKRHFDRMNPGGVSDATYIATSLYYREEIEALLPARKEARILDVGTGHGQMLRFLLEKGFVRITGIDVSEGLMGEVRARYGHLVERLEVADAEEFLPLHRGKYDCIVLVDMIEHLSEPKAASVLRASREALAPGGRVILRTPNMANLLGNYSLHMDLTHRRGYTEWSLLQLLEQSGFSAPQVFVPTEFTMRRRRQFARLNRILHEALYRLNDRVPAKWFGKNIVVWADREVGSS